ncbi:ROK family protein [Ruminiclostridium cellobioparum]|uniref:Transcriptional regulator/sugar kinase n=1 Tax=Ruminiclostridium cellobioparum subsp. termitidis CT1112 TaxID=1195236 RepID=S0FRE7_RUMCE|nr:ROK family protein [Ruminiclostridium cellobioparum]EMS71063.1 Transcriptional regulator/sugar kinase [Ruminiclostridium cellobioparum subsp. termitidis CT1112]
MNRSNIFSGLTLESKKILSLILHDQALTKSALSELSGLKLTSLSRMMQPLEELKLIAGSEIGESTGGRKPVLYDIDSRKYYLIGIDISRTYTQVVLTNLKMQPVKKYRFEMNGDSTPKLTLSIILSWIREVQEKIIRQNGSIIGMGIGTVGPLDRNSGVVLNPENFEAPGWENIHLKSIFEKRLEIPVVIDNGANAAVLAETCFGIGKGIKNVIYINCGVGIRTGLISSGVFVRNINDSEDAFAHMIIDLNGEKCSCGNRGCIETYSSIYSIAERFRECKKSAAQELQDKYSYIDICKAAESSDSSARQVIIEGAEIMGVGLANLIKLLNPGIVILSGPLIKHSGLFYEKCTETALDKIRTHGAGKLFFSNGGYFNENAISVGAAALVLENLLENKKLI